MAKVVWTRTALSRLAAIRAYIAQFNPDAADRIAARLLATGDSLDTFPERGRPAGRTARELATVPPCVIRYRVDGGRVLILGIRHGRQHSTN